MSRAQTTLIVIFGIIWSFGTYVSFTNAESFTLGPQLLANQWRFPVVLAAIVLCQVEPQSFVALFRTGARIGVLLLGFLAFGKEPIGPDFVALIVSLCVIAACDRRTSSVERALFAISALVAFALSTQRANLVFLGGAIAVLGVMVLARALIHNARAFAFAMLGSGVSIGVALFVGDFGMGDVLRRTYRGTFGGLQNYQSGQSRLATWDAAGESIADHMIIGQGLGYQFLRIEVGGGLLPSVITDNTYLDLALYFGVPCALILSMSLIYPLVASMRRSLRIGGDESMVMLALSTVYLGILGKAAVESLLLKPRMSVLLALLVAALYAGLRDRSSSIEHVRREPRESAVDTDPQGHRHRRSSRASFSHAPKFSHKTTVPSGRRAHE
ncbi:MAG: O-antigen ligase family protein, partial [Alphaproteobacteria bacterium]|nr:O-antigen ligase family protein [Alphaproteobacteria bacterium]MBU1802288.1 O-antigen ligase family protein [Actinomycetota bacterium]